MTCAPHREAKAQMALKGLRLRDVAKAARVNYSTASMVLNGRLIAPNKLRKLCAVIRALDPVQ